MNSLKVIDLTVIQTALALCPVMLTWISPQSFSRMVVCLSSNLIVTRPAYIERDGIIAIERCTYYSHLR